MYSMKMQKSPGALLSAGDFCIICNETCKYEL
jgi:hypothetical protein